MPESIEHYRLLRKFGLEKYRWVSDLMDSNRGLLPSPVHRIAPPHDPLSGLLLTVLLRDPNVLKAHVIHNLQDLMWDPGWPLHMIDRFRRSLRKVLVNLKSIGR